MSKEVKRYDPFGYDGLSALMHEDADGGWVRVENYEALRLELAEANADFVRIANERDALLAERGRMAKALESCMDALWEDSREVRLDDTMMFGHGYDWDGWEIFRWELHTRAGSFAIWPAHGTYSAYGGNDGSYWNQCFADAKEAKAAVVKHVARVDPEHPAAKAYALLEEYRAALQGEQL